ncbi:MAG: anti-sigma F factor antagonist, partial [Fibrobacter sp.]|nr:anti-sigma F factor antagonist [Fibrobacter sp.]
MEIGGREKKQYHIIDIVGKIDWLKDSIILKSYVNTLLEKNTFNIAMNLAQVTYLD